ncbi:hypothetical protein B0H14DRAFT_723070 [Mycena olivaceomarginata]|nr:hypothetical protein B0H14DRAFT_723070 [Mycena olivaceomarginata]
MWHPYQHPVFFALDSICPAINSNDYSAPSMHLPPPLEPHQKVCANRGEHTIFGFRVAHVASCTTISRKIPFLSASWFASSLSSAVREGLLQLGRVFKFPIAASSTQTMPAIHKLSIQFHGFLTSHIATLQIHISHSRGAAGPASKSRSQDELLSFFQKHRLQTDCAYEPCAEQQTYLSLTLFNNLHIGSG